METKGRFVRQAAALAAVLLAAAWFTWVVWPERKAAPPPGQSAITPAAPSNTPEIPPARPLASPPAPHETPTPAPPSPPKQVLKILFLGNSYTYVNDLPGAVEALAKASGQDPLIQATQKTAGGARLKDLWDGGAAGLIRDTAWNYVVLQEQSQTPLQAVGRDEFFYPFARKLDAEIKARGATTVFYMTWKRPGMANEQEDWTKSYLDITRELGATVSPAGMALEIAWKTKPKFAFYADLNGHPTPAGTYLVACTFFATIYDKSPAGLPASVTTAGGTTVGADPADAAFLQECAWEAVVAARKRLAADK